MIATALGRAALLATIPLAYWLGILTMAQLYVVSFLVGTLSVLFFVSYSTLFVSLVPREPVHRGDLASEQQPRDVLHRRPERRRPARAGVLGAGRDPRRRVLLPRLGALAEVDLAGRAADREGRARAPEGRRALHLALAGHPLRALLATTTINFFNFVFWALFLLYANRTLGVSPGVLGLVLGAASVGGLLGSFLTGRISRRIGVGPTFVIGCVLFPAPLVLVPLAGGPQWVIIVCLFASEFLSGFGVMLLDISAGAILRGARA